jgi:hypothetical protein
MQLGICYTLISLDLLLLIGNLFSILLFLALYLSLKQVSESYAIITLVVHCHLPIARTAVRGGYMSYLRRAPSSVLREGRRNEQETPPAEQPTGPRA